MKAAAWLAAALVAGSAHAGTVSLQGHFDADDDRAVFDFDLARADHLVARTLSYAGGVDASGSPVAAGGFAPALSLFQSGFGLLGMAAGSVTACPGAASFCWDAALDLDLGPGRYTLVLTQDGNLPLGDSPTAGFSQDGRPDFTGLDYLGLPGLRFIQVDGSARDGHWALELSNTPLPEPSTPALLAIALLAGLTRRRHLHR